LLGSGGGSLIAGKVGYAVSCLVAVVLLAVSGVAYHVVGQVNGLGGGISLGNGSTTGAMNVLVMGLESRTDFQGNQIDHHLQVVLHSGSQGGQATNTLILLHIFAGGQRAVGYSIPRDDWVTYPHTYDGQTTGKIDQAYGFAYQQSMNETVNSGKSMDDRAKLANQAGQGATVATVQAVTGQQVNHYAVVNLMGYYYLAGAFGGVTVCLKPWTAGNDQNLADTNSGWDAVGDGYNKAKGGTQYLHLSPAQSLAYVRDRDSLPNGDLDRTHRQQAVLDYVIWKMENGGVLSDLGQLTALLGTAKKYLITDSGWNLLDFSTNMKALSGKNLQFYTAPIASYATIDGQAANVIDIPTIQAAIKKKFTAPAPGAKPSGPATGKTGAKAAPVPPASSVTVDVYNGGTAPGLAAGISTALTAKGYKAGLVTDASAQSKTVTTGTQVFYGAGTAANASKIAGYFGATAAPLSTLTAGHVEVLIGTGATVVPSGLAAGAATPSGASGSSGSASPSSSASSTTAGDNGASGGAVTVTAHAKYGVPCIY
jgi:LCP family protein required for cell wall assembly